MRQYAARKKLLRRGAMALSFATTVLNKVNIKATFYETIQNEELTYEKTPERNQKDQNIPTNGIIVSPVPFLKEMN